MLLICERISTCNAKGSNLLTPVSPGSFFQVFHPAFPNLDEKTVLQSYRKKELPHVLVCEIYAVP
jgi:hypothetical protein